MSRKEEGSWEGVAFNKEGGRDFGQKMVLAEDWEKVFLKSSAVHSVCVRVATSQNAFNYTSQGALNERKERKK